MILALSGFFIVATIMLCTNPNKAYEKTKHFSSPNEIIEIINHKQLGALNKDGEFVTTSDFKECLSKRKRVTYSNFNYYKISRDGIIRDLDNILDLVNDSKRGMCKG